MTKTFLFSAKLLRFCNVKSLTAKHDRRYGSYKVQRVIFPWYCSIVKSLSMVPRRFQKYLDTIHTESKTALKSHLPFRYLEVSWGFLGGRKLPLEVEPTVSKAWGPSQWSPRGALSVERIFTLISLTLIFSSTHRQVERIFALISLTLMHGSMGPQLKDITSLEPSNGNTINFLSVRTTSEIFLFFSLDFKIFLQLYYSIFNGKFIIFSFPNKSVILIWKSHHLLLMFIEISLDSRIRKCKTCKL